MAWVLAWEPQSPQFPPRQGPQAWRPAWLQALSRWQWLPALLQVPRHNALARGFDGPAHAALVATNWVRTAAWSLRALLLVWAAARA